MKTRRYDGSELRRVLTAMVVDARVCSKVAGQWKPEGLFDSQWANVIGGWVVRYWLEYGSTPREQMVALFEAWAENGRADEKTVSQIEKFLQGLSSSYEPEPSDYVLDVAKRYFDRVRVERAIEAAKTDLELDKIEDAVSRLGMSRTNLGEDSYIEPSASPEMWVQLSMNERRRPLVTYRGDLGSFIGDYFLRGTFWSFMAPDKTGKTTWLIDFAYLAVRCGNRVAYFDTGDGDNEEVLNRMACRASGCAEWATTVQYPTGWDDNNELQVSERLIQQVDYLEAYRTFRKICKADNSFRVSSHSNSSLSVTDLNGILANWERDGWVPDVVVIDYADLLAPIRGFRDTIDQIDATWQALRRLSQDRHVCLMTATQAAASAYGKEGMLLSKSDFSGRKTKLAHVNGMLGINVSSKEKDADSCRINWIVRRKGRYNEKHYCRVAGCMAIGNPAIISRR